MTVSPISKGAKANGTTDDHKAVQSAIDQASDTFNQWCDGAFRTYAISQPIVLRPGSRIRQLTLKALSSYAPRDENNAMLMTSQGLKRAFTSDAGVITTTGAHGLPGDDVGVVFKGTLPAPLAAGRLYYCRERTTTTFKVAETKGGPALDVEAGTGSVYCEVLSLHKAFLDDVTLEGYDAPGVNGFFASLQQPARLSNVRINNCAVGYRLDGQQAQHENLEIVGCGKGLVLDVAGFMYFFGANIEQCGTGIELKNMHRSGFWGLHMESCEKSIHFPPGADVRAVVFDSPQIHVGNSVVCESDQTAYEIRNFAPYGGSGPETVIVDTSRDYTITRDQWGDTFSWESSFVQVRGQHPPLMQVRS